MGIALQLESLEAFRGDIAAWLLLGFGLAYLAWGIHRAIRNKPHSHVHVHEDETIHDHEHSHEHAHAHAHNARERKMTPWILFTIFVFGPCEPLIPLLMYPASKSSTAGMLLVTAVFAVATIGTMLTIVLLSSWGISFARIKRLERYSHALAGATVTLCGIAIHLGL
jgi:ABC-type nickel/cobalt efflux system permease component RcnA